MATADNDTEPGLELTSAHFRTRLSQRERSNTSISVQTQLSRFVSIPLRYMIEGSKVESQDREPILSTADHDAKIRFFEVILSQDGMVMQRGKAEPLPEPCSWYGTFLECRIRSSWESLVRPALIRLDNSSRVPLPGETGIAYNFLSVVAKLLLEGRQLAMVDMVDKLANDRLLNDQTDGERSIANQLVFVAVGWLTMLYDPSPRQRPQELEIRRPRARAHCRKTLLRPSRTFISYLQRDFDDIDQPLHIFFRRFGYLVPEVKYDIQSDSELIAVSNVCFAMLDKVAGIKIEWVNSLSLHLEFDNVRRILKVFRFPSFCKLMYRNNNIISGLYLDHAEHFREHDLEDPSQDQSYEYFREVILSYRLIFGQDKSSWKAFNKKWAHNRKLPPSEEMWHCSDDTGDDRDPMLLTLCGSSYKSPPAQDIYREIDAGDDISPYYYPDSDFPFLGRKILNLQTFTRGRNPHNWQALWHDRRNVGFWWTFWAVLFIGGGTILIGILQLGFQIWQSING